jgi:hypothetical protein
LASTLCPHSIDVCCDILMLCTAHEHACPLAPHTTRLCVHTLKSKLATQFFCFRLNCPVPSTIVRDYARVCRQAGNTIAAHNSSICHLFQVLQSVDCLRIGLHVLRFLFPLFFPNQFFMFWQQNKMTLEAGTPVRHSVPGGSILPYP